MFIARRLWRGRQPSKRLPTLKVEVQRTLEGRLFLNTWSVGKEELHIYLWYVWDEDAAMAQTFGSPFLRESLYSIHRSCSECIYMTWSIEICYTVSAMTGVLWNYQLIHVDKIAAFWTWSCQCLWFCLLSLPNHRLQSNTVPHHFTIYRNFFQLDVHMLKSGVPSHNFCENLDKSGLCEWVTTPHMARAFSIFLQTEFSMYLFLHLVQRVLIWATWKNRQQPIVVTVWWLLFWTLNIDFLSNIYIPWRQVK